MVNHNRPIDKNVAISRQLLKVLFSGFVLDFKGNHIWLIQRNTVRHGFLPLFNKILCIGLYPPVIRRVALYKRQITVCNVERGKERGNFLFSDEFL